jgi:hypothetical protein
VVKFVIIGSAVRYVVPCRISVVLLCGSTFSLRVSVASGINKIISEKMIFVHLLVNDNQLYNDAL